MFHLLIFVQESIIDDGSLLPGEAGGLLGKRYINMWIEVARLAGKHKATELVKRAAAVVRRLTWRLDVNREMIIRQADVDLILAAAVASEVARLPFSDETTSSLDTSEDHEDEKDDEELHRQEAEVCVPASVLVFAPAPLGVPKFLTH